ncbi:MAG: helix-turn-helix transcriptional regulator [Candidatus Eremiobacteraeota bacterium]|nr:helix-turn-helix transcriptional regulator [Candidatus Eremiobacteraeota bacterium]
MITRRRRALNLTQEQVASFAELSVRHYQFIESGEANPRFVSLIMLAGALEIRASKLLQDAGF